MTDQKKTMGKSGKGKKKLQLKKETVKDLNSLKDKAAAVKGGRAGMCCAPGSGSDYVLKTWGG